MKANPTPSSSEVSSPVTSNASSPASSASSTSSKKSVLDSTIDVLAEVSLNENSKPKKALLQQLITKLENERDSASSPASSVSSNDSSFSGQNLHRFLSNLLHLSVGLLINDKTKEGDVMWELLLTQLKRYEAMPQLYNLAKERNAQMFHDIVHGLVAKVENERDSFPSVFSKNN